jgi:glycosyltransferase involved in cell wall biosynthesis
MNVLFLSELFHPHGSGAEFATYLYANLLSEVGFNVVVVTNGFDGEPEVSKKGNLAIYRLPLFKEMESVKYSILKRVDVLLSGFARKMMKWADVIYIPRFWFSAIPLAKIYGKPVITHLHDYIPVCPLANLYETPEETVCSCNSLFCSARCIYMYERDRGRALVENLKSIMLNSTFGRYAGKLVSLSDAIICVSKGQRNLIVARTPSLYPRIHVVYNPLPDLSYTPLEGDDFVYFGGSSTTKGFRVLNQALAEIAGKKMTVRVAGFAQFTNEIVQLSNGVRIEKYGRIYDEALQNAYRSSRAVIFPSICPEPSPYVIYEALLRGRIVIASNIGGIPEQVDNCPGCFLFSPGNHRELADLIQHVSFLNRNEASELGRQNRQVVLSKDQNENSLSNFIRIVENLS